MMLRVIMAACALIWTSAAQAQQHEQKASISVRVVLTDQVELGVGAIILRDNNLAGDVILLPMRAIASDLDMALARLEEWRASPASARPDRVIVPPAEVQASSSQHAQAVIAQLRQIKAQDISRVGPPYSMIVTIPRP